MPGELNSVSTRAGQDDFADVRNFNSMCDFEAENLLVKPHGIFQVTDVDAVLIKAVFHRWLCPYDLAPARISAMEGPISSTIG